MKRLLFLLLLASPVFAQQGFTSSPPYTDPCQNPAIIKSSAFINVATATTTALVTVGPPQQPVLSSVYVCSYEVIMSGSTVAADAGYFEGGTGVACASAAVQLTATYTTGILAGNAPFYLSRSGPGMLFRTAAGSGLCFVTTTVATTAPTVGVSVTYVQQ
jgi:hypothetical protein